MHVFCASMFRRCSLSLSRSVFVADKNSFRTMTKCYLDLKHIYVRILIGNNRDFIRQSVCTAFIFTHTQRQSHNRHSQCTLSACVQRNKTHLFWAIFFFIPLILLCVLFITFVYSFVWTMCEKRKRKRCFCTQQIIVRPEQQKNNQEQNGIIKIME